MRIYLLGLMFNEKSLQEAYRFSKCGVQMAAHTFQESLRIGLVENHADLRVLNVPPVGSFPLKYKKIFIPDEEWGDGNYQIGYADIPFAKHWIQYRKIIHRLKEIQDGDAILIYSLYDPFLYAAKYIKKKKPNVKICLIQTDVVAGRNDMPKYMSSKAINKGKKQVELAKYCDCFVLLTKYLADAIEVQDRPYIVLECIANAMQKPSAYNADLRNICLYTGTVDKEFGILELINAFKRLPEGQLWICGTGNTEQILRQTEKECPNIRYFGFLKSDALEDLREKCDFLINPRRPEGTYTLYSFPSKTAEYLMTGKPTIMYKLEGIPDEYDGYMNYLSSSDPEEIAEELRQIFDRDYDTLLRKALRGREFMIEYKSCRAQAQRIMKLLGNEDE